MTVMAISTALTLFDPAPVTKRCSRCKQTKLLSGFRRNAARHDGLGVYCKICLRPSKAEKRAEQRKRLYGLTTADFEAILERQGGVCACCGSASPKGRGSFHVDHDHSCCPGKKSCGKCIRGLLCMVCNQRLGVYERHREQLAAYLKQVSS